MFFLKVESKDVERLLRVAAEKRGVSVERLARLAFLKGLRLLSIADAETIAIELSAERRPYSSRKPLEEIRAYIREHWQQQTDEQMAEALGYKRDTVNKHRLCLGLQRRSAAAEKPSIVVAKLSRAEKRTQKFAELDVLIREHWQTKDDWEIGRLLEPNVSGSKVRIRRFELELLRVNKVSKSAKAIASKIDGQEFERMVLHEGYTMTEYMKFKNLHCSRERVRQIAEQLGLKHSPEDRGPEWELVRKARKVNHLNLANREWLAEKITHYQAVSTLAAELKVEYRDLLFFIKSFELTHPSLRKYGAETVQLVCATCGKGFVRLNKTVNERMKTANGRPLNFYCSVLCGSKYDRIVSRARREAEMSPEARRLQELRQQKIEYEVAFIRDNWQTMSDAQLAKALGCSSTAMKCKRLALGLKRLG